MDFDLGYRTDVGRRRDHNEDYFGIYLPEREDEAAQRGTIFVVADGMGGYAAGEVASRTAVEKVIDAYYRDGSTEIEEAITSALVQANDAVIEEARKDSERSGMGTTMAVAIIRTAELAVANVGDSRVYLIRGGQVNQLTRDHSWVAELLAVGKITPEEARRHPMRNVVTRSLGGREHVEVETYPRTHLQSGDIVLVCSDGLWGMIAPDQIGPIVGSLSAQAAADALVAAANEAGGHDNITAIVCRILGSRDSTDFDATEQLDPLNLQDTQPIPRVGP